MGISPTQMLVVLAIVALLFGTSKLRNLGSDLGGAIRGFKQSMAEEQKHHVNAARQEEKTAGERSA